MVVVIVSAVAFLSNDGRGCCVRPGLVTHGCRGHLERRGYRDGWAIMTVGAIVTIFTVMIVVAIRAAVTVGLLWPLQSLQSSKLL